MIGENKKSASKRVIGVIPVRYASTRFPGKALAKINNKPMIYYVYINSLRSKLLDELIIATDSDLIKEECEKLNLNVTLTSSEHQSGTDRVIEVAERTGGEIYVNIQGDEPLIKGEMIDGVISPLNTKPEVELVSLMKSISKEADINDSNNVKVVTGLNHYALYFSRSVIPYPMDKNVNFLYYKHIGIYGYRKSTLLKAKELNPSELEKVEKLEQLRFLENNINIYMVETPFDSIGVDTREDFEKVKEILER